jgi:hypothetical protein
MSHETHTSHIDQGARDLAHRAISLIEQHQAVCAEAEKRRSQQIVDMRTSLESWLQRIQTSYDSSWSDMSQRHSNGITAVSNNVTKIWEVQNRTNEQLFNRFWILLWTYAGGVTIVAGVLLAQKLGV